MNDGLFLEPEVGGVMAYTRMAWARPAPSFECWIIVEWACDGAGCD